MSGTVQIDRSMQEHLLGTYIDFYGPQAILCPLKYQYLEIWLVQPV